MLIPKPTKPEDLYKFFIRGMPLKPADYDFRPNFRRRGWNIYTYGIQHDDGNHAIRLEFYSVMKKYYPDWVLGIFKYVNTKTN